MTAYIIRRVVLIIPTLFIVSLLAFFLIRWSYQGNIEPPPDSLPADEFAMIQPHLTDYQGDAEPALRSYELSGYLKPAARG